MIAQPGRAHGHPGKPDPAMAEAMKTYVAENVVPVITPLRQDLDEYLSSEEQAELADIRTGMKALQEEVKAFRATQPKPERGQAPSLEVRNQMRQFQKQRRQLTTRAWVIADAHEAEMDQLFGSIENEAEAWKEDMRAIVKEYRSERGTRPEGVEREKGSRQGHRQRGRGMMPDWEQPVKFLLWDANQPFPLLEEVRTSTRTFPNPAQSTNTLRYQINQPGLVEIVLINSQGQIVKNVLKAEQKAGDHTQQLDISDLKPGVYTYRISSPNGVQTQKLEIQ